MDKIQKWFEELSSPLEPDKMLPNDARHEVLKWRASAEALLHQVFGSAHPTSQQFASAWKTRFVGAISDSTQDASKRYELARPVFESAKIQFERGYLFDVRNLIHADVFSDELEQASYFLSGKWKIPALVIAGTVLESTLRELCSQHGISLSKATINPMNDELAKAGVYNKAMKTQILNWGQNRNSAAHGNQDELDSLGNDDVKRMIDGIRDFVAKQMN